MPNASRTVDKKHLTFNIRSIVKGQLSKVKGESKGFTLIELLVVITLFGIVSTLIVASYTTFERNQRIKNAAQTLKNDFRLAQNKALAGDKGAGGECPLASTLVGWYVSFNTVQASSYTYAGVCNTSGTEFSFPNPSKTVTYPSGVSLNTIKLGVNAQTGVITVLFKPLATNAALYSISAPPFISGSISFTENLTIELKGQQTSNLNTVTVRPTGEVSGN